MSCKYCENVNRKMDEMKIGEIVPYKKATYIVVGDGKPHPIPTLYCPFCGERIYEDGEVKE